MSKLQNNKPLYAVFWADKKYRITNKIGLASDSLLCNRNREIDNNERNAGNLIPVLAPLSKLKHYSNSPSKALPRCKGSCRDSSGSNRSCRTSFYCSTCSPPDIKERSVQQSIDDIMSYCSPNTGRSCFTEHVCK